EPYTPSNGYRLELDPNAIAAGQAAAIVDNQASRVITTNSMVIYAKSWCRYCQSVKRALDARYKDYKFAYVDSDLQFGGDEIHHAASLKSNMRTVPQIWVCGHLLGGTLKKYIE
uniref:Glutaredoxin domain-containing protein n=1 Tax=Romanomermis culicivorax TaxID=13658 RepID=A0A915JV59_ROMCU